MPLATVVVIVMIVGMLTSWRWGNVVWWFQVSPVLLIGIVVGMLLAIWLLIWRSITLTTDTLIIRQWRRTYRIPLRDITEIVYGRPTRGSLLLRPVGFHTATNRSMCGVSLGLSPGKAMTTIAQAVQAAGGGQPKLVF